MPDGQSKIFLIILLVAAVPAFWIVWRAVRLSAFFPLDPASRAKIRYELFARLSGLVLIAGAACVAMLFAALFSPSPPPPPPPPGPVVDQPASALERLLAERLPAPDVEERRHRELVEAVKSASRPRPAAAPADFPLSTPTLASMALSLVLMTFALFFCLRALSAPKPS